MLKENYGNQMSNMRLIKKKIKWHEPEGENGRMAQEALVEVVDNQIRDNEPPETKETFERLMKEGYSELDSKKLIANVVSYELFGMLKRKEVYNADRYIKALKSLPKLPGE